MAIVIGCFHAPPLLFRIFENVLPGSYAVTCELRGYSRNGDHVSLRKSFCHQRGFVTLEDRDELLGQGLKMHDDSAAFPTATSCAIQRML